MSAQLVGSVLALGIMLLLKWEKLRRFSTKLIHIYKNLSHALDCKQIDQMFSVNI